MTIYIVSGMHRSGTSMMMACARAGGMDVVYDPDRERFNELYGSHGYLPNPSGFWEVGYARYMDPQWLRDLNENHQGKVVKIQHEGLPLLPRGNWNVVLMTRDPREIVESMEGWWSDGQMPADFVSQYPALIENAREVLGSREDVTWQEMAYRDVVDRPVEMLGKLSWPLNLSGAVDVVNPAYCRQRVENFAVV